MPFLNKLLIFLFIPEMTPEEEDAVIGYLYRSRDGVRRNLLPAFNATLPFWRRHESWFRIFAPIVGAIIFFHYFNWNWNYPTIVVSTWPKKWWIKCMSDAGMYVCPISPRVHQPSPCVCVMSPPRVSPSPVEHPLSTFFNCQVFDPEGLRVCPFYCS